MSKDAVLVYSSDPEQNIKCQKCKQLMVECTCVSEEDPGNYKGAAVLRIEKQGRGGKVVTVIDRLPRNDSFLKNLTGILKKKCGAGGTSLIDARFGGVIEIQGDKREVIRSVLEKEGIKTRG